jgi:hypothetical protein
MKIRKIDLTLTQVLKLGGLGFLDTHDHLGPFINIPGRVHDFGAGFFISSICEAAGLAGIFLDKNLMSTLPHEFNTPRAHANAIFLGLDFF